ncbi:MAG: polysaccharide deacetylase family protein [Acidimicrobiales bacterium]
MTAGGTDPSRRRLLATGLGLAVAACGSGSRGGSAAPGTATPANSSTIIPPATADAPSTAPPPAGMADGPARFLQYGPASSGAVALTFHVAGDPAAARRLFDEAGRLQVPLTLFLVGTFVTANSAYVADLAKAGHEVANHTASHPTLGRLGASAVAAEVRGCRDALVAATGQAGRWFRPSGMDIATPLVLEQAGRAGYATVVGYDLDPHDYQDPGAAAVVERVRTGLHPGAIVSMHTAHEGTVAALPDVVAAVRAAGLRLVTVGDLLGPG